MDLDPHQKKAIRFQAYIGKDIQETYPEVADLYRRGYTYKYIAQALSISEKNAVTQTIAEKAIRKAIAGHDGRYNKTDSYEGLISPSELEHLAEEHMKAAGKFLHDNKLGFYASPPEDQLLWKKSGGQATAVLQGKALWSDEEKKELYVLSQNPEYTYGSHQINVKKIMQKINEIYHAGKSVRSRGAIAVFLSKKRKIYPQ